MARMSIDDMFLRDPRVIRLARLLGVSRFDARGRVLEVIGLVYDRVDDVLSGDDIDTAAELDGFAVRMAEVDLAVPVRGKYRIRGATERIGYLRTREESGRVGGLKSGETRRNKAKQTAKVTFEASEGQTKVTFEGDEAPLNPSAPDLVLVPDPVSASPPDPVDPRSEKNSARPPVGGTRSKVKPSEPSPDERDAAMFVLQKLGQRSGVRYSGANEHIRLITARLREGCSEDDLRKVIGYCAIELEWADDPEWSKYLRPETLFGPKTIAKYLDPARTWADKTGIELEPRTPMEAVP